MSLVQLYFLLSPLTKQTEIGCYSLSLLTVLLALLMSQIQCCFFAALPNSICTIITITENNTATVMVCLFPCLVLVCFRIYFGLLCLCTYHVQL